MGHVDCSSFRNQLSIVIKNIHIFSIYNLLKEELLEDPLGGCEVGNNIYNFINGLWSLCLDLCLLSWLKADMGSDINSTAQGHGWHTWMSYMTWLRGNDYVKNPCLALYQLYQGENTVSFTLFSPWYAWYEWMIRYEAVSVDTCIQSLTQ